MHQGGGLWDIDQVSGPVATPITDTLVFFRPLALLLKPHRGDSLAVEEQAQCHFASAGLRMGGQSKEMPPGETARGSNAGGGGEGRGEGWQGLLLLELPRKVPNIRHDADGRDECDARVPRPVLVECTLEALLTRTHIGSECQDQLRRCRGKKQSSGVPCRTQRTPPLLHMQGPRRLRGEPSLPRVDNASRCPSTPSNPPPPPLPMCLQLRLSTHSALQCALDRTRKCTGGYRF